MIWSWLQYFKKKWIDPFVTTMIGKNHLSDPFLMCT